MRHIVKLLLFVLALGWASDVEAQRRGGFRGGGSRGGGGRNFARSASRPSVNARPSRGGGFDRGRPSQMPSRPSVNRPATRPGGVDRPSQLPSRGGDRNINRDVNRNIDRNVNRDRDVNWGDGDIGWDNDWNDWGCCHYHPVARAAVATGAAYATAAAIGSIAYSLPSDCVTMYVNGISYYQCGSSWYEPQFVGTTTQYIVVDPPG